MSGRSFGRVSCFTPRVIERSPATPLRLSLPFRALPLAVDWIAGILGPLNPLQTSIALFAQALRSGTGGGHICIDDPRKNRELVSSDAR